MEKYPKVERDGKVAVLVSHGFGAGWFSWNSEHPECLFSPEIVDLVEKNPELDGNAVRKIKSLAKKLFGENFYFGGADDLAIEWIPKGTLFRIDEYDGAESLETRDGTDWIMA